MSMYKVLGYKEIAVGELKPHPLAKLPTSEEDLVSLRKDIEQKGQLDALIVNEKHQILDGCTRWAIAKELGHPTIRCQIVADADPRDVVVSKATTGRKQTTGSRLLITLYANAEAVLIAADCGQALMADPKLTVQDVLLGYKAVQRKAVADAIEHWSPEAIAERMGVSDKDVKLAIALLRAKMRHELPPDLKAAENFDGPLDPAKEEDAHVLAVVDGIYDGVLDGSTPIRRWKAALGGKLPTSNGQGKAETNHGDLCRRALISLTTAFSNWKKVKPLAFPEVESRWKAVLAVVPEHLEDLLVAEARRRNSKI